MGILGKRRTCADEGFWGTGDLEEQGIWGNRGFWGTKLLFNRKLLRAQISFITLKLFGIGICFGTLILSFRFPPSLNLLRSMDRPLFLLSPCLPKLKSHALASFHFRHWCLQEELRLRCLLQTHTATRITGVGLQDIGVAVRGPTSQLTSRTRGHSRIVRCYGFEVITWTLLWSRRQIPAMLSLQRSSSDGLDLVTRWIVVKKENLWAFDPRCFHPLVVSLAITAIYYPYSSPTLPLIHLHPTPKLPLQILTAHTSPPHHFALNPVIWASRSRSVDATLCRIGLGSVVTWGGGGGLLLD